MIIRLLSMVALCAAFWGVPSQAAAAPPGMPDPVKMSGIPRPDPALAVGTVTVRCLGAAGFTAVWAEENTRRSMFEAFRRKEIYASTGPRITLRFFGGFKLNKQHANSRTFVTDGYTLGVPMGGDLTASHAPKGGGPGFISAALKDPNGANLDRIQIIKGWLNADGSTEEKIYDIALSDSRTRGDAEVGNTVDYGVYQIGDV